MRTILEASVLRASAERALGSTSGDDAGMRDAQGLNHGRDDVDGEGGVAYKRYLEEDSKELGSGLYVGCERERLDSRVTAKFLA